MARPVALFLVLLFTLMSSGLAPADASVPVVPPVGLHLTGHVVSQNGTTWQFEITMEGQDLYFKKEWDGDQENKSATSKGFWSVEMAQGEFVGNTSMSWDPEYGAKGGGSSTERDGRARGLLARRLWQDSRFRGVKADELREAIEDGHDTEEFSQPIPSDSFPVPLKIYWNSLV
jgi:hypothetical protein